MQVHYCLRFQPAGAAKSQRTGWCWGCSSAVCFFGARDTSYVRDMAMPRRPADVARSAHQLTAPGAFHHAWRWRRRLRSSWLAGRVRVCCATTPDRSGGGAGEPGGKRGGRAQKDRPAGQDDRRARVVGSSGSHRMHAATCASPPAPQVHARTHAAAALA